MTAPRRNPFAPALIGCPRRLKRMVSSSGAGHNLDLLCSDAELPIKTKPRGSCWPELLGTLFLVAGPAPLSAQGTAAQRQACTPDVLRLCSALIPDAASITAVLRERKADLSEDCRNVLFAGTVIERTVGR
jgi:hypothetical protein